MTAIAIDLGLTPYSLRDACVRRTANRLDFAAAIDLDGWCLDAPSALPAGGMRREDGEVLDLVQPMQTRRA